MKFLFQTPRTSRKSRKIEKRRRLRTTLKIFISSYREEATRIAALEDEETQKICMMQSLAEMSRNTFSLSDSVKNMVGLCAYNSFIQVVLKFRKGLIHVNLKTSNAFLVLLADL